MFKYDINGISEEVLRELYRIMLKIRKVQLKIDELYHEDEMKTPVHLCIGQKATAAGVCAHLNANDYVFSNHRGHGHYIAKGGNVKAMIAELYNRETGCSKGRGGSMHLVDISVGLPRFTGPAKSSSVFIRLMSPAIKSSTKQKLLVWPPLP